MDHISIIALENCIDLTSQSDEVEQENEQKIVIWQSNKQTTDNEEPEQGAKEEN